MQRPLILPGTQCTRITQYIEGFPMQKYALAAVLLNAMWIDNALLH